MSGASASARVVPIRSAAPEPVARAAPAVGGGRIFQRNARWWISYYSRSIVLGKLRSVERRESAGPGATEEDARALLAIRLAAAEAGTLVTDDRRLTVGDAMDAWVRDLEFRRGKSLPRTYVHLKHVVNTLGPELAASITRDRAVRWMQDEARAGYKPGTIAHRVGLLRAALRLAHRDGRLERQPFIPHPHVNNARQGFLSVAEVDAITAGLTWPHDDIVRMLHATGWRHQEVLGLRWEWVEWATRTLLLPDSKNGDPRRIEMVGIVGEIIERALAKRDLRGPQGPTPSRGRPRGSCRIAIRRTLFGVAFSARRECERCALAAEEATRRAAPPEPEELSPYVFHLDGRRLRDILGPWHRARKQAGITHRVPHDLRRTMAKDATDAGIDTFSIMSLGGWRSLRMFTRYRIVDVRRTSAVLSGLQAFRAGGGTGPGAAAMGRPQ